MSVYDESAALGAPISFVFGNSENTSSASRQAPVHWPGTTTYTGLVNGSGSPGRFSARSLSLTGSRRAGSG